MCSLDPLANLRGEEDEEGNALPRQFETFCALFSIIMHGARICWVMENGLDGELTPELVRPGMLLPRHTLTMEKISASAIWSR